MASRYKHKRHGFQVRYRVYFRDGTYSEKTKYSKVKQRSHLLLQDAEKLETLSAKGRLTPEEVTFFLHLGFITADEAQMLTNEKVCLVNPRDITWEALRTVWEDHIIKVCSDTSRASYPYLFREVLAFFEKTPPITINSQKISDFMVHERKKGRQKASINKYLHVLRIIFDFLVENGAISVNPARQVKLMGGLQERKPRPLFDGEMATFLRKLKEHAHLCRGYFVEMAFSYMFTGMRRRELLFLRTESIHLEQKYIVCRGKGGKERIIEMHPFLVSVFHSVTRKNEGRTGAYFFGGYDEPVVRFDEASKAFKKVRLAAGLPNSVKLHSLRHTFITYAIRSGVDLIQVQNWAGHSRLSTTQKYTALVPYRESQIERVDFGLDLEGEDVLK